MQYPKSIERLCSLLHKLPGVGRRTSERYAFDLLLHWSEKERLDLQRALTELSGVGFCQTCGSISEGACSFCQNPARRQDQLCIVASPKEVFTLEQTREYSGLYHVLKGLLSPLDGRGEEALGLESLFARIKTQDVKEIILALDSSLEGDATCLFLKEELKVFPVSVSRLAFGIPVGSSLEYVDGGTLARALSARSSY
jgi:recombination protein RecR